MYYFLTASKDATIYSNEPNKNTGLDSVLEVGKTYNISDNSLEIRRALLKFDVSSLPTYVTQSECVFILRETESNNLPLEFDLYVYPISSSWEMGDSEYYDTVSEFGVTWLYREKSTSLVWQSGSFQTNVTASNATGSGGVYYFVSESVQNFQYNTKDIEMDISSMVNTWISGTLPNEGLIIKLSNDDEVGDLDFGTLKFFSKETNTIHQPKIRIGWDVSSFETGSLSSVGNGSIKVVLKGLKNEYKVNTIARIRLSARELYPLKTFSSTFVYDISKYLPETTYYQIRDLLSDTIIVPFSEYTKVSCDSTGNYFDLNLVNWEAGRDYKIEFKVERDGLVDYFDNDDVFSLVK